MVTLHECVRSSTNGVVDQTLCMLSAVHPARELVSEVLEERVRSLDLEACLRTDLGHKIAKEELRGPGCRERQTLEP